MQPIAVKITKHSGKPREWRIWWDVGWIALMVCALTSALYWHQYVAAVVDTVPLILWLVMLHIDLKKFERTVTEETYTLTGKEEE